MLRHSGHIFEPQYNHLLTSAGCIPLIYGLPKLHKLDSPLWLIVLCLILHLPTVEAPMLPRGTTTRPNIPPFPVFYFYCHPRNWLWGIQSILWYYCLTVCHNTCHSGCKQRLKIRHTPSRKVLPRCPQDCHTAWVLSRYSILRVLLQTDPWYGDGFLKPI